MCGFLFLCLIAFLIWRHYTKDIRKEAAATGAPTPEEQLVSRVRKSVVEAADTVSETVAETASNISDSYNAHKAAKAEAAAHVSDAELVAKAKELGMDIDVSIDELCDAILAQAAQAQVEAMPDNMDKHQKAAMCLGLR